jgi:hypothetical protein
MQTTRWSMIRILAIAALFLLAGSIPGDADAARPTSVRLTLDKQGFYQAKGSGFLPNLSSDPCCGVVVDYNGCTVDDCAFHLIYYLGTDSKGNWSNGTGFSCSFRTFSITATDSGNNTATSKTVTNKPC